MLNITDLPDEVLLMIVKATSAGDTDSLRKSFRRLRQVAQTRLEFHKRKRAETENIVISSNGSGPLEHHPLYHLRNILKNDDIRFYTKVVEISCLSFEVAENREQGGVRTPKGGEGNEKRTSQEELVDEVQSRYEHQISALVARVYDSLLPYAENIDLRMWIDSILSGERAAIVILLLALYPYLKILHLKDTSQDWIEEEESVENGKSMLMPYTKEAACVALFRTLTAIARVPINNKLKVFSKLSELHLRNPTSEYFFQDHLAIVAPFMALPTMRRTQGSLVDGRDVRWPYGIGASDVTEIDLCGDIDTASVLNLISGLRKLEVFCFNLSSLEIKVESDHADRDRLKWGPHVNNDSSNPDPDDENMDDSSEESLSESDPSWPRWEPRAITESLLDYACNSLVSLDLTIMGFTGVAKLSGDEPFICSLRPFQVLKHVRVDAMMVFERVKSPSTVPRNSIRQNAQYAIRARRLVDFLPMSIESLCMTCESVGMGFSEKDVKAMFTGLPKQKARVPNFSYIRFDWMAAWASSHPRDLKGEKKGWKELNKRCEDNDIELVTNDEYGLP